MSIKVGEPVFIGTSEDYEQAKRQRALEPAVHTEQAADFRAVEERDVEQPVDPKGIAGSKKAPLQLLPTEPLRQMAWSLEEGRRKYGYYNWRGTAVAASVYVGAIKRHLDQFIDGEVLDRDTPFEDLVGKKTHLGGALAGLAILIDAMENSPYFIDDRPVAMKPEEEPSDEGDNSIPF